jgi:hypothetical protein
MPLCSVNRPTDKQHVSSWHMFLKYRMQEAIKFIKPEGLKSFWIPLGLPAIAG